MPFPFISLDRQAYPVYPFGTKTKPQHLKPAWAFLAHVPQRLCLDSQGRSQLTRIHVDVVSHLGLPKLADHFSPDFPPFFIDAQSGVIGDEAILQFLNVGSNPNKTRNKERRNAYKARKEKQGKKRQVS